jgi:hypothetical protein
VLDEPRASAALAAVLRFGEPRESEVEAQGATVLLRALPLAPGGEPRGALVLVRDVTELRHRDRQLMGKDATIREIHHRVKNNLQTVAALLRLQARRVESPQAQAALEESVRRVASIALVHETLSQTLEGTVPFDEVADRVLAMCSEVAAPEAEVAVRRSGSFGELPAEVATALAMVLTELVQNAVEHGYPAPARGPSTYGPAASRAGCGSRCATTGRGCRTASTSTPRPPSACGSCARWWRASCAARCRCGSAPVAGPSRRCWCRRCRASQERCRLRRCGRRLLVRSGA